MHRVQRVVAKQRGDLLGLPCQRGAVGAGAVEDAQPHRVVLREQGGTLLRRGLGRSGVYAQREPALQKVAAEGHVLLPVSGDGGAGPLEEDGRVGKAAAQEGCLGIHDPLRALPVPVREPVVVRHAGVHGVELRVQLPRRTVKHHQHRWRAERPAPLVADADSGTGHARGRAAVQTAHGRDVVVLQKAHDEVALAEQIVPLGVRQLGVRLDTGEQQRAQLQHFRDLLPGEHPPHQHEQRQRVRLKRTARARVQKRQHLLGAERREQDARIVLDHLQHSVVVFPLPVGGERVQILPVRCVPRAVAAVIRTARLLRQRGERLLGTDLHHVVETVAHTVRQAGDEGVLLREHGQKSVSVRVAGDKACHRRGELIRQSHDGQKLLLPGRERLDHGGGKHGVNVRVPVRQRAALGKRAQVQIYGRKPPLARMQQRFDLRIGQVRTAAVRVDGQLRVVEPQMLGPDRVDPAAQPHDGVAGEEAVAARHDQVHVLRQAVDERAQKLRDAPVGQQMEIVDEDVHASAPGQTVAEIVRQQARAGGIVRAGVAAQQRQPCVFECVLHALPEDDRMVGIDADAHHSRVLGLRPPGEIPVHGRRLTVAHGGDHGRQRAAGDGAQPLLQALGDIDRVQGPLRPWHSRTLPSGVIDTFIVPCPART